VRRDRRCPTGLHAKRPCRRSRDPHADEEGEEEEVVEEASVVGVATKLAVVAETADLLGCR